MRSAMPPSGESSPRSNLKSRLSPIKRLEAKKETTQGKRETAPGSKPRSRFRPQPQAGLIASLRDERLLTDLFLQRVMSRSQLQVLHCSAEPSCNAQLRQLFDWRFLSRLYLPTAPFGSQALYSVGKAAVPLVTARLAREGLALELDDIRIQCRPPALSLLAHTLAISDIYTAMQQAVAAHPQVALERWLPERLCRHEYEVRRHEEEQAPRRRWRAVCLRKFLAQTNSELWW